MQTIQLFAVLQVYVVVVSVSGSALVSPDEASDSEARRNDETHDKEAQSKVTSITPNSSWLYSAMNGYDPAMSDSSSNEDPGVRQRIFEPICPRLCSLSLSPVNQNCLESFVSRARDDHRCSKQFRAQTVTSIEQYKDAVVSSSYQLLDDSGESDRRTNEFIFRTFGRDDTVHEQEVRSFFEETSGEIIRSVSECISHSVAITPYEKPKFTKGFKKAIHSINFAVGDPESDDSRQRVRRFFSTYGTHFMQETKLGAKIIFEVFLKKRSIDAEHELRRKNCAEQAARASITGFDGKETEPPPLQDTFSTAYDNCVQEKFLNASKYTLKVISIGTFPFENIIVASPLPIYFTLQKITSLIKTIWLNDAEPYPLDDNYFDHGFVDGRQLSSFLEVKMRRYCELVFGSCPAPSACALNSNKCFALDTCDDSSGFYECTSRTHNQLHYGGAVTTGGLTVDGPIASSLAIPPASIVPHRLPVAVSNHTLSFVNGVLYSCGGQVQGLGSTSICYTLSINDGSGAWRDDLQLPQPVSGHTAVVVADHIWFVSDNKLFDLDTSTKLIKPFDLPFEVTSGHCAVSNGKHSYIIGVGKGRSDVCYNTEAYKPGKWTCIEPEKRIAMGNHACVWIDSIVYISGVGLQNDWYVLHTVDEEIKPMTIDSRYSRSNHEMMVLDQLATLVGGKDDKTFVQYEPAGKKWITKNITLPRPLYSFGLAQLPASADVF